MTHKQIKKIYGNPPFYPWLKWPETNRILEDKSVKAHWTLMGFWDMCKIPVICQVIDAIWERKIDKSYI